MRKRQEVNQCILPGGNRSLRLIPVGVIWLAVLLSSASAASRSLPNPIVGQIVAPYVVLDGVRMISGVTLMSGSIVETQNFPATIHLELGPVLELARNSRARFASRPLGEVEVEILSGVLFYRESTRSELASLIADERVVFSQRQHGLPVASQPVGVVAVLSRRAEDGDSELKVNDSRKVNLLEPLLIRTRDGEIQELHCRIDGLPDDTTVDLDDDLAFRFEPLDLLIQRRSGGFALRPRHEAAVLSEPAGEGDDALQVISLDEIDPLDRIIIEKSDRSRSEVQCVQSVNDHQVFLMSGLKFDFEKDDKIFQGASVPAQYGATGIVGVLERPAEEGARRIFLDETNRLNAGDQLLIRGPQGGNQEIHCVSFIEGNWVTLTDTLNHDFEVESVIVQGQRVREAMRTQTAQLRLDNCCCCCNPVAAFWPWWALLGGAGVPSTTIVFPLPPRDDGPVSPFFPESDGP